MTDDFDLTIRREFISEASEMLEAVESAFIELEQNPGNKPVIDKIFRLAHTIKGSAMSCGFNALGDFAHHMETLLVNIREAKITMKPEIVDVLLKSTDCLNAWVAGLKENMAYVITTQDIVQMLQAFSSEENNIAKKDTFASGLHLFEDEPSIDLTAIKNATKDLILSGMNSYRDVLQLSLLHEKDHNFKQALDKIEEIMDKISKLRDAVRASSN